MDSTDPRLELLSKWHAEGLLAKAGFTEGTKGELEETTLGGKYNKDNSAKGASANNTRNIIKKIIKEHTKSHPQQTPSPGNHNRNHPRAQVTCHNPTHNLALQRLPHLAMEDLECNPAM